MPQITEYAWLKVLDGKLVSFRPTHPGFSELTRETSIGDVLRNLIISEWCLSDPGSTPANGEAELQIERQCDDYPPKDNITVVSLDGEEGSFDEIVRRVQYRYEVNGWTLRRVISTTNAGQHLFFSKPEGAPDSQPFAEPHMKD